MSGAGANFTGLFSGSSANFSGKIGVGTATPGRPLEVIAGSQVGGDIEVAAYGAGSTPIIGTRSARGTLATPSAVLSADSLGLFQVRGFKPSGFTDSVAGISFNASENWTNSATGSFITFFDTASGTTTAVERMRISDDGNVGIGMIAPSTQLEIGDFTKGVDQYITLKTAGGNLRKAGIAFRHFDATGGFNIEDSELIGSNGLKFVRYPFAAPVTAMFIDRFNGNVGIGTTGPGVPLDVVGTVTQSTGPGKYFDSNTANVTASRRRTCPSASGPRGTSSAR